MKRICVIIMLSVLLLAGCSSLDVVGNDSGRAFEAVLQKIPAVDNDGKWSIDAPDGSAHFLWNGASAGLAVDAQPFIDAGLDAAQLPNISEGKILINIDFPGGSAEKSAPVEDYKNIAHISPDSINYHAEMDHYGLKLGDGNMFEWAKDQQKNSTNGENQELDMVFVLNPEPFLAAGVDPASVEGWVYAPVEMMDANGGKVEVDKFLKPFNLE